MEQTGRGNKNFKGYFRAIGNVPKRLQDVNHASQRSEMREGRQREGPSLPFCTGYFQELRHRGRFEMCEGQGEVLASEMERDGNELNWVSGRLRPSEREGRPLPAHGEVPWWASPNERGSWQSLGDLRCLS